MTSNNSASESGLIKHYQRTIADISNSPAGVMWPHRPLVLGFDALTHHFASDGFSVLDHGCGLGHLKACLDQRFIKYDYHGVNLVPEFINMVDVKYPDARVQLGRSHEVVTTPVDHMAISETFNIIDSVDHHFYVE
jgi:hypothetical protein